MRPLLALTLVALAAASAFTAVTGAQREPRKPIASYCSPSGDVCYGVVKKTGAVYFEVTTPARYFLRYRLCVRPPARRPTCRSFPMRPGAAWSSSVRFAGNYRYRGPGIYRATWSQSGHALGPTLRFRLPLRS